MRGGGPGGGHERPGLPRRSSSGTPLPSTPGNPETGSPGPEMGRPGPGTGCPGSLGTERTVTLMVQFPDRPPGGVPAAACRTFRCSTVICRISAFSSFTEPFKPNQFSTAQSQSHQFSLTCFSAAVGTRRRSSDRLWLILSLRLFSMTWSEIRGQSCDQTVCYGVCGGSNSPPCVCSSPSVRGGGLS